MKSLFDGYNYVVRLDRGERLAESMRAFLAEFEIPGAWVSGIGGVSEIELGFYDLEAQQYRWRTMTQLLEITSLQGSVATSEDGVQMMHLHGTFGDRDYQVVGGHVKDFVVSGTCELLVHRTFKPLARSHDPETGLNILSL